MTFPFPLLCGATNNIATPASITWNGGDSSTTNTASYTTVFTATSIGTAASNRYCVFGITAGVVADQTISSVTVNGNAPTLLLNVRDTPTTKGHMVLYGISIPTGTTANVRVFWSDTVNRCSVLSWSLYDLQSTTPTTYQVKGANGNPYTISSISYPAGSVALAGAGSYDGGTARTHVWTGLTERTDTNVESGVVVTAADKEFASALSGQSVTIKPSVATLNTLACAMLVFR